MAYIELSTYIDAPLELVFDLSRSIDFHMESTPGTNEVAIAGTTTGLIEMDETVTWRATHLGFRQTLTSKITGFRRPHYFADEQHKGIFKWFRHEHFYEREGDGTRLKDIFEFESPGGTIGKWFNKIFLRGYMQRMLETRNQIMKEWAESDRWQSLPGMEHHLHNPSPALEH